MKVSVVGTGYVGLVSGVCLASKGHSVTCIDIDENKVRLINSGVPPIYEQGLEELLKETVGVRLCATSDLASAVLASEISLIAVGTPFDGDKIDLTFVRTAAEQIGRALKKKDGFHTVVVKSTVVPGTTDSVVLPIVEETSGKKSGQQIGIGMNPEFLREGAAVQDFMNPDRIVLGGDDRAIAALEELYAVFGDAVPFVITNTRTAEMIKYTANSLLATMISFSNEIANLSSAIGEIDVVDVMEGVHLDHRLQPILESGERIKPGFTSYVEAGCGFGGSCFPKDVKALIAHGKEHKLAMSLLDSVIEVNEQQPNQLIKLLLRHFPKLTDRKILVLGLAFKPETDDMRESPAIPIVQRLLAEDAKVSAYDPVAQSEAEKIFGADLIHYHSNLSDAVRDIDAILLMTRWAEFEALPKLLANRNDQPLIVDGRRMLRKTSVARYEGVGL